MEAQSTLIEHKLGFLLDSVECLFNKSMLMVEKGHSEMMDSVQDVNTLLQEQKAALIETFTYLNDQSTKLLTLWNLIRPILKAVGFASVLTFIVAVVACCIIIRLYSTTTLKNILEFVEHLIYGTLAAIVISVFLSWLS